MTRTLIIVTSAEIDHDMLVAIEEHDRNGVVELIHLVEVGHFRDVDHIKGRKVDALGRDGSEAVLRT